MKFMYIRLNQYVGLVRDISKKILIRRLTMGLVALKIESSRPSRMFK